MQDKLIVFKTFNNPINANIAKGLLESNGIESVLKDENTIYTNPIYTTALGGIKLLINESDYDDAVSLFSDSEADNINSNENSICPICNSDDITIKNKHNWFMLLMMFLSFSFTPNAGNFKVSKCNNCKHIWEDSDKE